MVLGTATLKHKKNISWPTTRGKDVLKRIFVGIHDRFQSDPVYLDSQLKIAWSRSLRWTN